MNSIAGIITPATTPRAFLVTDASKGGANGLISVTAGSVTDLTNSGTVWTGISGNIIYINDPVYGNVPFAQMQGSGSSARLPKLQLNPAATCAYLSATVDSSTGFIIAYSILSDSGGGMPSSTNVLFNTLLTSLTVTITAGKAKVTPLNDGAQSSLNFAICGVTPLIDGNSYRVGT